MMNRRDFLGGGLATATSLLPTDLLAAPPAAHSPQQLWQQFCARFIQPDGRVIDHGAAARSTSEGQAYALFHALVLRDRATFDSVLGWTRNNLCGGDLGQQLPAWSWGQHPDGRWGVLDGNNATDADLLIAYCLAEAPAHFSGYALPTDFNSLQRRLAQDCLRETRAFGPMLLPAAQGFEHGEMLRLNPSYLMRPVFRRLALAAPSGPWAALDHSAARFLLASAQPRGIARDWTEVSRRDPRGRMHGDAAGSYDAIRVYLWAGLSEDRATAQAHRGLLPYVRRGQVPERIDALSGRSSAAGGALLSAALLPWLSLLGQRAMEALHRKRLLAGLGHDYTLRQTGYYEANLALFTEAWRQSQYRFTVGGRLERGLGE